jgi:hypothetical protein
MTSESLQGGIANASGNEARVVACGLACKEAVVSSRFSANLCQEKKLQAEGGIKALCS